jgi:hypothetical protein
MKSLVKRAALKTLTQSDRILGETEVKAIAEAMALLSEYLGGYELFGVHLENATVKDCVEVFQQQYQTVRNEEDRRQMGRHYTPNNLVRFMCHNTLGTGKSKNQDLGLARKLEQVKALPVEQQLETLLQFSTADISCGSGVFLIRAVRSIGLEVARIAFQSQHLTHDQIEFGLLLATQRCIYGVDKDPLAVELCKLSLWLNATQQHCLTDLPLPPLSNIRCGDSLIGVDKLSVLQQGIPDAFYKTSGSEDKTIAAELRKRNKQERACFKIAATSGSLETLRTACNVWSSVPFIPKVAGALVPTTNTLQCVLNGKIPSEQQAIVNHVNDVAARLRFFHWRLEFPDVFLNTQAFIPPNEVRSESQLSQLSLHL